jgi:hypothetical protein
VFDQFEVQTYLDTRTLTNKEMPQRYQQSMVSALADAITKLPLFEGKLPNIQHVYVSSFQKRSEIIETKSGYTLVHDYYTTINFSFVNRFAFQAPPPAASTGFFRSLQAVRLIGLGFFDEAEFLFRVSSLDGYGLTNYLHEVQAHKKLASLQDIFLLLHEHAHLLYSRTEQYKEAFKLWHKSMHSHPVIFLHETGCSGTLASHVLLEGSKFSGRSILRLTSVTPDGKSLGAQICSGRFRAGRVGLGNSPLFSSVASHRQRREQCGSIG